MAWIQKKSLAMRAMNAVRFTSMKKRPQNAMAALILCRLSHADVAGLSTLRKRKRRSAAPDVHLAYSAFSNINFAV